MHRNYRYIYRKATALMQALEALVRHARDCEADTQSLEAPELVAAMHSKLNDIAFLERTPHVIAVPPDGREETQN